MCGLRVIDGRVVWCAGVAAGGTLEALEGGDLKLRVRVLESERADRRSGLMQVRARRGAMCGAGWA